MDLDSPRGSAENLAIQVLTFPADVRDVKIGAGSVRGYRGTLWSLGKRGLEERATT